MTIKITKEMLESEPKGFSIRMPKLVHQTLKAEAALNGKTKDELMLDLIIEGIKHRN